MPFMFEREGDFTELLIPANLLADDSVLNRAVKVLTEDVCQDVEVIGWLYQFYISERKDEVFAGFKKNKKAGADEIPAATQLFTPHWIVRYLVENSLGRLWMLNRPSSGLVDQMDYYIAPVDEETDFLKITKPEELKVIDPACGSGHMLTYAFDLLYAIYEEEGYAPAEIPGLILTNNLYGTEIDPRAGALAAFALTMKARAKQRTFFNKQVEPNICVLDPISFSPDELDFLVTEDGDRHAEAAFWNQFAEADTFGSLIQPDPELTARLARHLETLDDGGDMLRPTCSSGPSGSLRQAEYLAARYAVVVANPPYMGSKNMGARLGDVREATVSRRASPTSIAMFIERAIELVARRGLVGDDHDAVVDVPDVASRRFAASSLVDATLVDSFVHLGDGRLRHDRLGAVVSTAAFVAGRAAHRARRVYRATRRLSMASEAHVETLLPRSQTGASGSIVLDRRSRRFPGRRSPTGSRDAMRRAFCESQPSRRLSRAARGHGHGDNDRFLRYWWEVSVGSHRLRMRDRTRRWRHGARWFPYNKGGDFRRWYGNHEYVVDWEDDGERSSFGLTHGGRVRSRLTTWTTTSSQRSRGRTSASGAPAFRYLPGGFVFDVTGTCVFPDGATTTARLLGYLELVVRSQVLTALAPTLNFEVGDIAQSADRPDRLRATSSELCRELVEIAKRDWDRLGDVVGFRGVRLAASAAGQLVADAVSVESRDGSDVLASSQRRERQNDALIAESYGLERRCRLRCRRIDVSLARTSQFAYGRAATRTCGDSRERRCRGPRLVRRRLHVRALQPRRAGADPRRPGRDVAGLPREGADADLRCRTRTTSSRSWMATGSRTTSSRGSASSSAWPSASSTSRRTCGSSPSRSA